MCFSAQASFGAAAVLTIIGIYSLKSAQKKTLPLALIPIFFAIQQCAEGILWLTYNNPAHPTIATGATYLFAFFALFFWPTWIPFTTVCMEENPTRKKILYLFLFFGTVASGILAFTVLTQGITLEVACSHIRYTIMFSNALLEQTGPLFYCLVTILPLFISSRRFMPFFGLLVCASVAITYLFYTTFFVSVWCFFAATLSSMIILMV